MRPSSTGKGIISKNANTPYRSDRNEGWLKIKTAQRGTFPVIGFVKDPTGVAALYLGKREGKDLVYMGKVGTGWSRTISSQIRKQLDTVVSPKSKLTKPVRSRRPRGSSRPSPPTWSTATSRRKGCCGKAPSRVCLGTNGDWPTLFLQASAFPSAVARARLCCPAPFGPRGRALTGVLSMPEPTEEQIKRRAYELWQQAGSPEGRDDDFYQLAKQELRNEDKSNPLRTPDNL
jgi:hypothetical protein